jgi:acetyltransferase-like isoleucine patch superfamily enzyme
MSLKSTLGAARPPREYVLNHVVNRIPLVEPRMAAYERLGVRFQDRRQAVIMLMTEVWTPQRLSIGAGVSIGRHVLLDARGGLEVGDGANISSYTRFMTAKHVVDDPDFAHLYEPIVIGDHAWVALGATVLGGVTIGAGAVVAAASVVTADVAPYTVVGGAPARLLRERRSGPLDYHIDYRPDWA